MREQDLANLRNVYERYLLYTKAYLRLRDMVDLNSQIYCTVLKQLEESGACSANNIADLMVAVQMKE